MPPPGLQPLPPTSSRNGVSSRLRKTLCSVPPPTTNPPPPRGEGSLSVAHRAVRQRVLVADELLVLLRQVLRLVTGGPVQLLAALFRLLAAHADQSQIGPEAFLQVPAERELIRVRLT